MWMLERYYDEITEGHPDRSQIQPVNITAAARWFLAGTEKAVWKLREDFPIVTPPFPEMWMEYVPPDFINNGGSIVNTNSAIKSCGCMVSCIEVDKSASKEIFERDLIGQMIMSEALSKGRQVNRSSNYSQESMIANQRAVDAGREVQWITIWKLFAEHRTHGLMHVYSCGMYVDPDGLGIPENNRYFDGIALNNQVLSRNGFTVDDLKGKLGSELNAFFFATSLMHAKNVSLQDDPIPAPVARRRAKDGKPNITFKILKIDPMRKQAKSESSEGESDTKRAMHIVRGHFKDYRNSGGLFGKYKGLYWWDMHVAGSESAGKVIKDYKLV